MDNEQLMNEVYKRNKWEIDRVIKDNHEISKELRRSSGMSDDGTMKFAGRIPWPIYTAMMRANGPDCWNDDKFVAAFLKAYNRFLIGNRP